MVFTGFFHSLNIPSTSAPLNEITDFTYTYNSITITKTLSDATDWSWTLNGVSQGTVTGASGLNQTYNLPSGRLYNGDVVVVTMNTSSVTKTLSGLQAVTSVTQIDADTFRVNKATSDATNWSWTYNGVSQGTVSGTSGTTQNYNISGFLLNSGDTIVVTMLGSTASRTMSGLQKSVPYTASGDMTGIQAEGPTYLNNQDQGVIKIEGNFTSSTTNTLYETGGAGQGAVVYMYSGTLYAQGGNGSLGGSIELSYTLGSGKISDIVFSFENNPGGQQCYLYINGLLKDSGTNTSTADMSGGNASGTGQQWGNSIATTRMGTAGAQGSFQITNGTISRCRTYPGNSL